MSAAAKAITEAAEASTTWSRVEIHTDEANVRSAAIPPQARLPAGPGRLPPARGAGRVRPLADLGPAVMAMSRRGSGRRGCGRRWRRPGDGWRRRTGSDERRPRSPRRHRLRPAPRPAPP